VERAEMRQDRADRIALGVVVLDDEEAKVRDADRRGRRGADGG
jgi:hypothetical protein